MKLFLRELSGTNSAYLVSIGRHYPITQIKHSSAGLYCYFFNDKGIDDWLFIKDGSFPNNWELLEGNEQSNTLHSLSNNALMPLFLHWKDRVTSDIVKVDSLVRINDIICEEKNKWYVRKVAGMPGTHITDDYNYDVEKVTINRAGLSLAFINNVGYESTIGLADGDMPSTWILHDGNNLNKYSLNHLYKNWPEGLKSVTGNQLIKQANGEIGIANDVQPIQPATVTTKILAVPLNTLNHPRLTKNKQYRVTSVKKVGQSLQLLFFDDGDKIFVLSFHSGKLPSHWKVEDSNRVCYDDVLVTLYNKWNYGESEIDCIAVDCNAIDWEKHLVSTIAKEPSCKLTVKFKPSVKCITEGYWCEDTHYDVTHIWKDNHGHLVCYISDDRKLQWTKTFNPYHQNFNLFINGEQVSSVDVLAAWPMDRLDQTIIPEDLTWKGSAPAPKHNITIPFDRKIALRFNAESDNDFTIGKYYEVLSIEVDQHYTIYMGINSNTGTNYCIPFNESPNKEFSIHVNGFEVSYQSIRYALPQKSSNQRFTCNQLGPISVGKQRHIRDSVSLSQKMTSNIVPLKLVLQYVGKSASNNTYTVGKYYPVETIAVEGALDLILSFTMDSGNPYKQLFGPNCRNWKISHVHDISVYNLSFAQVADMVNKQLNMTGDTITPDKLIIDMSTLTRNPNGCYYYHELSTGRTLTELSGYSITGIEPPESNMLAITKQMVDNGAGIGIRKVSNTDTFLNEPTDSVPSKDPSFIFPSTKDIMTSTNSKPNRSFTMLQIKDITTINGRDSAEYSNDKLIELIREQESLIAGLDQIKAKSNAIDKQRKKHQDNIDRLTKLLDARPE